MKISVNNQYTTLYNNRMQYQYTHSANFKGVSVLPKPKSNLFKPLKQAMQPLKDFYHNHILHNTAKGIVKILETDSFKSFYKWTKDKNMIPHLLCLTSIILSGFYVQQTLTNKKLDEQKRKTLAINQTAVAALSAVMSYTFDGKASKYISKFADRFTAINAKNERLGVYLDGINAAKSIIIFGTIYRFIAPVIVTPIANHIGNKLNEKKEAKMA